MNSNCTRHFLDWNHPALDSAAAWILDNTPQSNELDLSLTHIVVPGARARRVLLGNLVDLANQHNLALTPPLILTPWETPAALLGTQGQPASPITQKLAWIQALQTCDTDSLKALIPDPPEPNNWPAWSGLAQSISTTAKQLADAGIRMNQVPELGDQILDEYETQRWTTLGTIQSTYEQLLTELDVIDDALASMDQVASSDPCDSPNRTLILVGLAQLGSIARGAIQHSGCDIQSLIFAPESLADRFDDLGCVLTDQWLTLSTEIQESRIIFEQNPISMCQRSLTELAKRKNPMDTSQCVIGLADESMLGLLRRRASLIHPDHTIHSPAGINATTTLPGQLITLIADYIKDLSFESLSNLIRHPDIEQALSNQTDSNNTQPAWWLKAFDAVRQDHVLTTTTSLPAGVYHKHAKAVQFILDTIAQLLSELIDTKHPLDIWASKLTTTLQSIYSDHQLDPQSKTDHQTAQGLTSIRTVLDEINDAKQLGQSLPAIAGSDALGLILDRLSEISFAETPTRNALETLGWLELPLDSAPICIVIGMSESCVPGSITHDPLIPGSLRNALNMPTNDDQLARDTYIMSAINASRDAVFMCARLGDKGDPITPSRLLLNTQGPKLAQRIRRFVDPKLDTPPTHHLEIKSSSSQSDLFLPTLTVPENFTPPTSMRVTDFDAYLQSPALWYLQRHLSLEEIDTDIRELSPSHMGSLIHDVLDSFGKDTTMRDLDDPDAINTALVHLLDEEVQTQFGSKPPAAILVQAQLLRYRFEWFAIQQAHRRAQGWRILHSEWTPDESFTPSIIVDGTPMELRGKIDRIDIHDDGRWAVIDYKTGQLQDANKAHLHNDHWRKLQLPLYRFLVEQLIQDQPLTLGYAGLPSKESESIWSWATWNTDQLAEADEAARTIVRAIRNMKPNDPIDMGDSPPDSGTLGFITGINFDTGGFQWHDPETEVTP